MYLSSGWTIPDLDNKYKEIFANRDDWGLLPYPKGEIAASATGSWSYGITNNHHTDKSAITELYLWMASEESSRAITTATGMIPARRSAQKTYDSSSPEWTLQKQLEISGKERPVTVAYPTFTTCFNNVIASLETRNLDDLLNSNANNLQSEMDRLKARG